MLAMNLYALDFRVEQARKDILAQSSTHSQIYLSQVTEPMK